MTFKQLLDTYKDVPAYKLVVANEVDCFFKEIVLNDDEFEYVCDYVYDYIMHSDISVNELCTIMRNAIEEEELTISLIINEPEKADEIIYSRM